MNQRMVLQTPQQRQETSAFPRRIPVSQMRARALQGHVGRAASQTLGRVLFYAEDNGEGALVAHVTDGLIADDLGVSRKTVTRHRAKLASKLSWVEVTCDHTGVLWVIQTTEQRARTELGQGGDTSGSSEGHCGDTTEQRARTELGHGGDSAGTCDDETPISQEHPHTPPMGECAGASDLTDTHPPGHALLLEAFAAFGIEPPNTFILEEVACKIQGGVPEDLRRAYIGDTLNAWRREKRREDLAPSMLRDRISWWLGDRERADAKAAEVRGDATRPNATATGLGFDEEPTTTLPAEPRVKSLNERIGKIARKIEKLSPHAWATTLGAIADAKKMDDLDAAEQLVRDAYAKDCEAWHAKMARRAS